MAAPRPSPMMSTEVRLLQSKATRGRYALSIALPLAYNNQEAAKIAPLVDSRGTWPVVYLLDSSWYFGMVTDMVHFSSWGGRTTDAIIVGIGYPEEDSPPETWRKVVQRRFHDLTTRQSDESERYNSAWLKAPVKTGGGPELLTFLKQELIPLIDREYHTDPAQRILVGHSHGGGLALFAMLREPGLFQTYVASSPSLDFADDFLFKLEDEYAVKHKTLPAKVYLSAGELEQDAAADDQTLSNMQRFAAILDSRKYEGFSLTKQVIPDYNHFELAAPAFQAGLSMALKK